MYPETDARPRAPRLVTPPAALPLTLEEVKRHLRIRVSTEDPRILSLIRTAAQLIDAATAYMSVCMLPQTWSQSFDRCFPRIRGDDDQVRDCIALLRGPVIAVASVTYIAPDGTQQTLDPTAYDVFLADDAELTRIEPKPGTSFPATRCQAEAVTVTYSAGYPGTDDDPAANVPDPIKTALLFIIEDLHRNVTRDDRRINGTAEALLHDFRRQAV